MALPPSGNPPESNSLPPSPQGSGSRNRSATLVRLLEICARDSDLQQRLQRTGSLHEFMAACQAAGHLLEARELQLWAHCKEFDAPWWPWAELDAQARARFFSGN